MATDTATWTKAIETVRPSAFLDYRVFLESLYAHLKQARGGDYSYQRFAEDLGFKATTVMHQIVRGYRPLTVKAAAKVVKAMDLRGTERKYFMALVEFGNAKQSAAREELFEKLVALKAETLPDETDKDTLEYFSEWYHPVIRELVGTKGFEPDPAWIAGRIGPKIRAEQAKESLELLARLGLIKWDDEKKTFVQTQSRVSTGHRVKGMALARYHQKMIDHAREALTRVSSKRRDISALTLAVDEATAEKLRGMIHAFQLQLLDTAEKAGSGDQVFQVNIQLFPFTE